MTSAEQVFLADGVPPSLTLLCVACLLEKSNQYENCDEIVPALKSLGLEHMITQAAGLSLGAFAGLRYLASDWYIVDESRKQIATFSQLVGIRFFESLRKQLYGLNTSDRIYDDVIAVCKAMLGNDRFKRDMPKPLLTKPVADACRRLRNVAQARSTKADASPQQRSASLYINYAAAPRQQLRQWRFQDLRTQRRPALPRNPHFPGYDH